MFGVGTSELLIIFLVALLVIGPSKLPEVARALGKALAEFRKVSTDVKRQIDLEVQLADLEKTTPPQNKDNTESNEISSKNIKEKSEDTPPSDNQQK
ncbi:Sec-independent protein translocase protein TatB [Desulfothermus naphthae]